MKLRYLLPSAFGKFRCDEPVVFDDGLNLIHGGNEAGKSTLEAFIHGMFYGFKREGKSRVSRLPEYERYRPWAGAEYRGVIGYLHEGRKYRIERAFDPDAVRVFDDDTGDDISRSFSMDSRREYDFAARHLGMTAKEFRNTVWIGQLGSAQEPGLGAEIQGRLEDIVQGGAEDVSLVRALGVLSDQRSKIKTPRGTRGALDGLRERLAALDAETRAAAAREADVRAWLVELSSLRETRSELEERIAATQSELDGMKIRMLLSLRSELAGIDEHVASLRDASSQRAWAKETPAGAREEHEALSRDRLAAISRRDEILAELAELEQTRASLGSRLAASDRVSALGVDEAGIASLYGRYIAAKATATKGERAANDARRELRRAEEDARSSGLLERDFGDEPVRRLDELQSTVAVAEKQGSALQVLLEKERGSMGARVTGGGVSGWLYGLALGLLAAAVVLTLLGLSFSIPAFAAAVGIFAIGAFRHRRAVQARHEAEDSLKAREQEVLEQDGRVEEAKEALSEYLAGFGVSSIDQFRAILRESSAVRNRQKGAQDKYEMARSYWFEANQDYSAAEKELASLLRASGTIGQTDGVTDSAVQSLRRALASLSALSVEKAAADERLSQVRGTVESLDHKVQDLVKREEDFLAGLGALSSADLIARSKAKEEYDEIERTLDALTSRRDGLLRGRTKDAIEEELEGLLATQSGVPVPGVAEVTSETDYENLRKEQDAQKSRMSNVAAEVASLERVILIKSDEGRSLTEIEEEAAACRELENSMTLDRDALELAESALGEISRDIRREFAPLLNARVGEILETITSGRYSEVKVSPDLAASVIHPDTNGITDPSFLSAGTLDQCYFALRVALAEIITKSGDFPLFLDDSFVLYDDDRLERVVSLLHTLSSNHQILLFTCHRREEALLQRLGIPHKALELGS